MSQWRSDTRTRVQALRAAFRRPGPERDALLLLVKAAVATVVAWQFAVHVLHSRIPFYAPMAALLVVDRTMVRSLLASAQRVAAVVLGLGVAWVVASLFGVTWWTMFGVVLVALVIGRWSRLGDHGIQVPSMVLLSLITVGGTDEQFTYLTIVETIAGGLIGVGVNALVLTPLHVIKPRQRVTRLATEVRQLLDDMAAGIRREWTGAEAREWLERSAAITERAPRIIDDIETGRESTRFNLRDNLRPLDVDWEGYEATVRALRRLLWQTTGIARVLVDAGERREHQPRPKESFLLRYAEALDSLGTALEQFGRHDDDTLRVFDENTGRATEILTTLRDEVRNTELDDPDEWPVYGSLLSDGLRMTTELRSAREAAVVPTDTGPLRLPPTESEVWVKVQRSAKHVPWRRPGR
ncbi:aromatic acid exporter family member 1 [Terracoccus luteus]|uniref:Aromatic acid exporter family member 1 n=1 Tax=Terracoccus luteus TaxID=53356 RepID=A0A495Y270_9MICO|nr:aromatic acid exporter family protein [Terracoccus luteus]RKT79495.1 aromatic acid exporter family member 1 [Terracoccus luteus]